MLWFSVSLGFLHHKNALLSGVIGFEVNDYIQSFTGKTGLVLILLFLIIAFMVLRYKLNIDAYLEKVKQNKIERES